MCYVLNVRFFILMTIVAVGFVAFALSSMNELTKDGEREYYIQATEKLIKR